MFSFDGELMLSSDSCFVASVEGGIKDRARLFQVIGDALLFPDYFGNNWDALEECLSDLEWIKYSSVCLRHYDIPLDDTNDRKVYLLILWEAVQRHQEVKAVDFVVSFPMNTKEAVMSIVCSGNDVSDR